MRSIRIHYLQHVPFEGLGCIETWANEKGHLLTSTKFFEDYTFPNLADFDWLVIMGGPMGVNEEDKYLWLKEEKQFINRAIQAGKAVVGICLGAQLIAAALGAKIYANPNKEIGWFDVSLTKEGREHPLMLGFEPIFKTFHWHGDTFDLPEGALHLFQSAGCRNQGFLYKGSVLGLQFHFEVTEESLGEMIEHGRHELIPDDFVQAEQDILQHKADIEGNNQKIFSILDRLEKIPIATFKKIQG